MADFKKALDITNKNEGWYSNAEADSGGETVRGISRNNWPKWGGWPIVDAYKQRSPDTATLNHYLMGSTQILELIEDFYKQNFWDVMKLDAINDQSIANATYDFGVNSGTGRSAKTLQTAASVASDGIIGGHTIDAVNNGDAREIYASFCELRKSFYEEIAQKPGQGQFLHSWLSRIRAYGE